MTQIVDDGLNLVHAAGQKVRDGVGAVRTPKRSAQSARVVELVASITGAIAAFFVSRLVRSRLGRPGR